MTGQPPPAARAVRVTPRPGDLPGDEPRDVDPAKAAVEPSGPDRAVVHAGDGRATGVVVGAIRPPRAGSPVTIEVVVDGWRFELEIEDAERAGLRERATLGRTRGTGSGPLEIHAMIPGRVAAAAVVPGDSVVAGQTLLVVEAMKMQNEIRAPRDGVVDRLMVGVGETIDLGDLLVVLA